MKYHVLLLFIAISSVLFGQQSKGTCLRDVEAFIVDFKLDSARHALTSCSTTDKAYAEILKGLSEKKVLNSSQYLDFFSSVSNRTDIDHFKLYDFFITELPKPSRSTFDYDFSQLYWMIINCLRNESAFEETELLQDEFVEYVSSFDSTLPDVRKAKILVDAHAVVMKVIERNPEGLALSEKSEKEALALGDTNLIILTLYNRCDLLIFKGKLDEYIQVSRQCYELDKARKKKSYLYFANIVHLIDALVYKGGEDEFVLELLEEFYNSDRRELSYSLFAKYLGYSSPNSEQAQLIFEKFQVTSIQEFCDTIKAMGEPLLNPSDYWHLLSECALTLEKYGEFEYALKYQGKLIGVTKAIYAKDLSKSIANHQSKLVEREKELELKSEREQTTLYGIIAILSLVTLLFLFIVFVRTRRQGKALQRKNIQIEEQRKALERSDDEKSLLLKEIHHRVKNNFQIVSSLLELQAKGIEDEKALGVMMEGRNRVKSMAIIHQKLYQNDDLLIDFDDYLKRLVREIQIMYADQEMSIEYDIQQNVSLDIDTAIPLGLILNELVTNVFKYGYQVGAKNQLQIRFEKKEDHYTMTVSDSGSGIPDTVDLSKAKSVGLRLVRRLSKQLFGEATYTFNDGAEFQIVFKDTPMRLQS